MEKRIFQLDALRGLAAMVVVLSHWRHVFFDDHIANLAKASVFSNPAIYLQYASKMLVSGVGAVIVFFVLSGFVLTISLEEPSETYPRFVVKRIARIYLPFVVAIVLAIVLETAVPHGLTLPLGDWFNQLWKTAPDQKLFAAHILMLGSPQFQVLDPPMWSLVHEMRVSLIFPALYLLTYRNTRAALIGFVALSVVSVLLSHGASPLVKSWLDSLQLGFLFVAGAALAIHRKQVGAYVQGLGRYKKLTAFVFCFCLTALPAGGRNWMYYPISIGACGLVALCYADSSSEGFLRLPVLQFLGRISYSLYLVHVPLLVATVWLLYGLVPNGVLAAIGIGVALGAATIFHLLVEVPSQRLGRHLTVLHKPVKP